MLNQIKEDFNWGLKVGGNGYNNLDNEQVKWLIEQAEKLQKTNNPDTDFNVKWTEMKLEEIRIYLASLSPANHEETREKTLDLVVEHFYSRFFQEIQKAKEKENIPCEK